MPRTMKTWNLERGRRGALRLRVLAACAAVLIASGAARSQDSLIQFGKGVTLRVVDQGTEDMGPLARSSRMSRIDLRMPSGFDRVYRVESSTLGDAAPARYARVSGALVAIFPRSEYATSERGTSILVPAGTVYAIGAESAATVMASQRPSTLPRPETMDRRASARVDTRVEMRAESAATRVEMSAVRELATGSDTGADASAPAGDWSPSAAGIAAPMSIWTDERYRAARITALLDHPGE